MEWKDIQGYESRYQVSTAGLVRSLPQRNRPVQLLKPYLTQNNAIVSLQKDGHSHKVRVSTLVLSAFGTWRKGYVVVHRNGNPHDNSLANLDVQTKAQVMRQLHHSGKMPRSPSEMVIENNRRRRLAYEQAHFHYAPDGTLTITCTACHKQQAVSAYRLRANGQNVRQCKTCEAKRQGTHQPNRNKHTAHNAHQRTQNRY